MNDRYNNAVGPQVRAKKKRTGKVIPTLATLTLGGGLQAKAGFEQTVTTYVRGKKGYKHRLLGMIDESTTRRPSSPCTFSSGETTEASLVPKEHVPTGW